MSIALIGSDHWNFELYLNKSLIMLTSAMASSRSWRCPSCYSFAAHILKSVLQHIGVVHTHEANFCVTCGIQGCPDSYCNYHSYKKHMYQKHCEVLEVATVPSASEAQVLEPIEIDDYTCGSSDTTTYPAHTGEKKQSALFLLKATAVRKVSKTALDDLIGDIAILLDSRIQLLQESIRYCPTAQGVRIWCGTCCSLLKAQSYNTFSRSAQWISLEEVLQRGNGLSAPTECLMYYHLGSWLLYFRIVTPTDIWINLWRLIIQKVKSSNPFIKLFNCKKLLTNTVTKKKLHLVWYYSFKEVMHDVMRKSTGDGEAQNFFKYSLHADLSLLI